MTLTELQAKYPGTRAVTYSNGDVQAIVPAYLPTMGEAIRYSDGSPETTINLF